MEMVENGTTEAITDIKSAYQTMRVHLKEAKYVPLLLLLLPVSSSH
jgi:hypothetical protein